MKRFYRTLGVAAGVLLLAAVAEWAATVWFSKCAKGCFNTVSDLEIDPDIARSKAPGEIRIFILGDHPARPTASQWRSSIEHTLKEKIDLSLVDRPVQVVNCTWPGKGSFQMLLGMEAALRHEPDLVILSLGASELSMPNALYAHSPLLRWLTAMPCHSALARLALRRLDNLRKLYLYGDESFQEHESFPEFLVRLFNGSPDVLDPRVRSRAWGHYEANVSRILTLAGARQLPVALVGLPAGSPGSREANDALKRLSQSHGMFWLEFPQSERPTEALAYEILREEFARGNFTAGESLAPTPGGDLKP